MLYLPIACPGSGKSFLAKRMVEAGIIDADAVVSPDRYREILTGERANQKCNSQVFKIVNTIVESRISHGLDVYLDATNLNPKLRKKFLERLESISFDFTLPLTILLSEAPRSVVERRNVDRAHPVPQHVFDRFYAQVEALDAQQFIFRYGAELITFDEMLDKCLTEEILTLDDYGFEGSL